MALASASRAMGRWWRRLTRRVQAMSGAFLAAGAFIPARCPSHPLRRPPPPPTPLLPSRRFVRSLVLRNGDGGPSLRVGTYSLLGTRSFEVPLRGMRFAHRTAAAAGQSMSTFEVPGKRWRFLLDAKSGTFHDKRLYNWIAQNARM